MKQSTWFLALPLCFFILFLSSGAFSSKTEGDTKVRDEQSGGVGAGPEFTNEVGMKFVLIPAGTFMMGSPSDEPGRASIEMQHQVTISRSFYMQTTEVTQDQWRAVMGNNPSHFSNCGDGCPVEKVSWYDAQKFIQALNAKEGGNKYRLPTEAEWEYAARAGSKTAFANGGITVTGCGHDSNLDRIGWYCGNSGYKTHRVAQKQPNLWGLYDMHGNVWEWCHDWYGDYPSGYVTDPSGPPSGFIRANRGGSHSGFAKFCRSANRIRYMPSDHTDDLGFRLARTL